MPYSMTQVIESDSAVSLYSQIPKKYNCAQVVAKAFGRDDLVTPLKSCGGGRAKGGLCGALHAALLLLPEEKRDTVKEQFRDRAGALRCQTICRDGKTPCTECVRIAAGLVAEMQNQYH